MSVGSKASHYRIFVTALTLCVLCSANVFSQTYPAKSIRFIVPFPAGGGNDLLAREIGQRLTESMGQSVVTDNRPGASTIIGTSLAAKSPPDGYTIFMGNNSTLCINPSMFRNLPYDPIKDFAPITLVATVPMALLVNTSLQVKNVKELIALAKARPGQLNFASTGTGLAVHLAGEMLKSMAKINITHVPYKGAGPALIDTIGGHVEMTFNNVLSAVPYVKDGKLRAIAVTGLNRSSALPDVPAMREAGPELANYESNIWYGVLVPAATPKDIVNRLHSEIVKALHVPSLRDRLAREGAEVVGNTPDEFERIIRDDIEKWARVVKQSNLKVEDL